jgi:hypothetical protein
MFLFDDEHGFASLQTLSMEVIMQRFARVALAGAALLAASAAFPVAFTSPAHAAFFSASCSGSVTMQTCVFDASSFGNLFIGNNGVDVNLSVNITGTSESFTGGTATSSTINITGNTNVDGIGDFTVRDDLSSSGSPGNPTADTVTLVITGTNLALATNAAGNQFGGHICFNGETNGGTCSTTFFSSPTTVGVPGPIVGAGLPGLIAACGGLLVLARRRRQLVV